MNALHTDVTGTTHSTSLRRRWTRALAVGAVAAAAVVGTAGAAQGGTAAGAPHGTGLGGLEMQPLTLAATGYHIAGAGSAGSSVVRDPGDAGAAAVATLADGTGFTVDCGVRGRSVKGNTVWHHITAPVTGYIADYYTDTPGFNQFIAGEAACVAPPVVVPPPATATRGQTITYNEGAPGSCIYYALDRFHQLTGVYPKAFGDARLVGTSAAAHGWTVSATPRVDSIAIFQPGDNGAAGGTGHAAWVEQVSGNRIYVAEMNAPTAWVVTHRWIDAPAASVRYVYAA